MRQRTTIAALAVACAVLVATAGKAADFYVATDGNDRWSGRLAAPSPGGDDGPFATLEGARDAIRKQKQEGLRKPVHVVVRGGTYYLPAPFQLTAEDSGTDKCPILYAAHPGEKPILSGGSPISGWRKPAEGNVWTAEIPGAGTGGWYFHQLFVGGQRRVLRRHAQ